MGLHTQRSDCKIRSTKDFQFLVNVSSKSRISQDVSGAPLTAAPNTSRYRRTTSEVSTVGLSLGTGIPGGRFWGSPTGKEFW